MNKTRNLKKALSLVLVLMMVVSTMVIVPLTASALDGVDGSGTQEDPYVLSNAAECNTLKSNVGSLTSPVYVELDADISGFTGAFVGSNWGTGYTYVWHIDGQGHTMSGLTTWLFGGCAAGSTFSNLTIANSNIKLSASNSGAWVGYGSGTFTNCVLADDVKVWTPGANNHLGGFVGSCNGAVSFTNCVNNATVENPRNAGGFIGATGKNVTFTNCVNNGDIFGGTTVTTVTVAEQTAGGFIGLHETGVITFNNCINNGETTAPMKAAGFVGHSKNQASGEIYYNNSYNLGESHLTKYAELTANGVELTIDNDGTIEEARAAITPARKDGTPLASLTAWDGATKTEPALLDSAAENSATNPYQIGTAEELAWLSTTAGYYAVLTDNINMGGTVSLAIKAGTLDGQNYTIYNAYNNEYSAGFVTTMSADLNFSNLHFVGLKVVSSGTTVGLIAATGYGNDATLTNVTIDTSSLLNSTRTNGNNTGGFIGNVYGDAVATITNCSMGAMVSGYDRGTSGESIYVAGIVAMTQGTNNVIVSNVIVEGGVHKPYNGTLASNAFIGTSAGTQVLSEVYYAPAINAGVAVKGASGSYTGTYAVSEEYEEEIATIAKMGVTATVGAYQGIRLKLTDDFGFMPIYATGAEKFNPHVTYGIKVDNEFVAGEFFNGDSASFCVPYAGVSVAKMDQDVTYTPVIMVNGYEIATGASKTVNCYTTAKTIYEGDGYYGDALVTEDLEEIALYGAMATYCEKYNAYVGSIPQ